LPVVDGVVVALALVVAVVEDELVEEPPHAVNARLTSTMRITAAAVGKRLRLLLMV
jgi:hypothetical protein